MALAEIAVDHDPIIMPADGAAYVLVRVLSAPRWTGPEWTGVLEIDVDASFHVWQRQVAPTIELEPSWFSGPGSHRIPVSTGGGAWLLAITPTPHQPWVALRFRLAVDDGPPSTAIATWSSRDRSNPDARRLVSSLITQTMLVDSLHGLVTAMEQGDAAAGQTHFRATWDLARRVGRADVVTDLDRFGNRPGLARAQALLLMAMRTDIDLDLASQTGPYATRPAQPRGEPHAPPGYFQPPQQQTGQMSVPWWEHDNRTGTSRPIDDEPPGGSTPMAATYWGGGGVSGRSQAADPDVVVNTGFAEATGTLEPCSVDATLRAGHRYLFWLDIAPLNVMTMERAPAPLPAELPANAVLTVVVFGFPGEIEPDAESTMGLLRLRPGQAAIVVQQPTAFHSAHWPGTRLAFPVSTPAKSGTVRLRCNIYFRQLLVQSRLIEVTVTQNSQPLPHALRSILDFRIADPKTLMARDPGTTYHASFELEGNGNGTHQLRIAADGGTRTLCADTTIAEGELATTIKVARSALQRVAWGTDTAWHEDLEYRYATPVPRSQLATDLISLAVNGFRLHHVLLRKLGRSTGKSAYEMETTLRRTLAKPGFVQFALREGARHVVPIALLYDLPLNTQARYLRLCPDFEQAQTDGQVMSSDCLRGECRQAQAPDDSVVCPGGFWGYRHALGLPLSIGTAASLPDHLDGRAASQITGGVYQDFQLVDEHRAALGNLLPGLQVSLADDHATTLSALRTGQPNVVYFYCHGGVEYSVPYLRVGRGFNEPVITPDNLFHHRIQWAQQRPLVFLNGCRTTDVSPESAIDFVSFFVQDAWACGVIGTEITVFEQLAAAFAEECLRGFLGHGLPIGLAVRQARIAALARGNPLGLAYVPFVLPEIRFLNSGPDHTSPKVRSRPNPG